MGRGSRGSGHQTARRPVDLTGIISLAEKNDFITLLNAITENMHRDMSNMFDSPPVRPIHGEAEHHHWLSLPLLQRRGSNKENVSTPNMVHGNGRASFSTTYEKTHRIIEKEENEALTPQLRELKKEALAYFRKWQGNVLQRMREIHVNETIPCASGSRSRGRGGRGACRAGSRGRDRGGRGGALPSTLATGPPRTPPNHVDPELAARHPPIPNTLWTLHLERRKLFLHIALLVLISLQDYNANSRILLVCTASSLNLPYRVYQMDENRLAQGLARAALEVPPEADGAAKPEETKPSKKWKLGFGGTSGSTTTISLAGPLKNVGIGTAQGGLGLTSAAAAGLMGIMAENGVLMGSLFGMNPTRPLSKMLEAFLREVQDFAFVRICNASIRYEYTDPRESPVEDRRLRVVIAMGGCLLSAEDVVKPWQSLSNQAEVYAIRWETAALMNLGGALETVIKSTAWGSARRDIEARTIFQSLISSTWPEPLLRISKIIDNPWSVGMVRAEKAGAVLADSLIRQRFQGERPVSLIGFSLAARAIYACLMVLAERRQFGIVDSVVMLGTPAPSESRVWLTLKSVVSGRLVNVYSESDYILGFLYRTSNIQFGIAGLQEIQGADGVENYCVKTLPRGHLSYPSMIGTILRELGWEDLDVKAVRAESVRPLTQRGKKKASR